MGSTESAKDQRFRGRRRVIRLAAAVSGLGLAGAIGAMVGRPTEPELAPHRWQGTALGADASLLIAHPDGERARRLIALSLAEIERLERIFSLYRTDSALARLNAAGELRDPPAELVDLLERAQRWSGLSGGAFDVTVQPLWRLYQAHFAQPGADPSGPPDADIAAARGLVDHRAVEVSGKRIALARPGMALTLNGITQGEITDRVADLLAGEGLEHALIDLGEMRALSSPQATRPWKVGIKDPHQDGALLAKVALTNRALATSATTGTHFDAEGQHQHLLDPQAGRPSRGLVSASVIARRARDADALSTALLAAPERLAPHRVAPMGIDQILTVDGTGRTEHWRAPA